MQRDFEKEKLTNYEIIILTISHQEAGSL